MFQIFSDNLTNLVAGLGTEKDKTTHGHFRHRFLSKGEIDSMYTGDWIAGTLIDAPCDDMTREWRSWKAGPRQVQAIEAAERKFNIRQKVNHALKLARLHGGSAILLGTGDADPSKPLDLRTIRKGSLKYVHVLSRYEIFAGPLDRDPMSLFFGEPTYYTIAMVTKGESPQIHPSRVIRFLGQPVLELSVSFDGWGLSTLQRIYDAVRQAATVAGNLASLTHEAKTDVIKVPNLTQNVVNPEYRAKVLTRFGLANQAKSINNALLLDKDEEWNQRQISFGHFPEVLRQYIEVAAGAGQMPVTRLLGSTPGGLSNNNDGSLRHYYDTCSSRQEIELRPCLERLDEALVRHAIGAYPSGVWYEFKPLWQLTDEELSAIALRKAQTTQIYAALGVMPKDALQRAARSQISEDGLYPGIDAIFEDTADQPSEPLIQKVAGAVNQARASSTVPAGESGIADTDG